MPVDLGAPEGRTADSSLARNDKKERIVVEKGLLPKDTAFFIYLGGPKAHLTLGMTTRRALLKEKEPLFKGIGVCWANETICPLPR
jgi:hypothetical protein